MSEGDNDQGNTIRIKCSDSDLTLSVDKSMLKASSKYFENCLSFEPDVKDISFDPTIISFETLKLVVNFLEEPDDDHEYENLENLFRAADYLQMDSLLKSGYGLLERFLEYGKKTPAMIRMLLRLYKICVNYTATYTPKCSVTSVLSAHFNWIKTEQDFFNLPCELVEKILDDRSLKFDSELDILRTVKLWVNHDYVNRKIYFPQLLRFVRYDDKKVMTEQIFDHLWCDCTPNDSVCLHSNDYCTAYMAREKNLCRDSMFQIKRRI